MTLFGTTLDGAQIAGLVGLLATLVFWVFVLRREKDGVTAFRRWEAERKARKDAEDGVASTQPPKPGEKRGPWG